MTEPINDKKMEETNEDSQDSETSSTSSWILMSADESFEEYVVRNKNETLFTEAHTNSAQESKTPSDIDSDGISVISENEFYQCKIGVLLEDNQWYAEDRLARAQDDNEAADESIQDSDEVETNGIIEAISPNIEIDHHSEESVINDNNNEMSLLPTDSQTNCRCNLNQTFDYGRLLTWPSLLGTSVLIFAVFIFPFFSSDVKNKELGNMKHDVYNLPEENLDNAGSLIFCREKHKKGSTKSEYHFEKCLKDEANSGNIRKERFPSNQRSGNIGNSYLKQGKKEYDTVKNKMSFEKNNRGKNFDQTWKSTKDNMVHNNQDAEIQFDQDMGNNADVNSDDFARYEFDRLQEQFDEKRKYLLQKEKYLKEWEQKLVEKERKIKQDKRRAKIKDNKNKQSDNKINSIKRHEGDFYDAHKTGDGENKKAKNSFKHQGKYNKNKQCISDKCNNKNNLRKKEPSETEKESYSEEEVNKKDAKRTNSSPRKKFKKHNRYDEKTIKNTEEFARSNSKSRFSVNTNQNYLRMQPSPRKNQTKLFDEDNATITGEWYLNLVHGRHDIRKREEKALWWFDRVEYRKKKRNKAHWYFQYMFNRENLRYRSKNI